jgi:uncharacterized integral membrane protein
MSERDQISAQTEDGRRARPFLWALFGGAIIGLISLITSNTRKVEVDWVFGSSRPSLILVILVAAALGFVVGCAASFLLFRRKGRPG